MDAPTAPPSRQTRRFERKREAILAAAAGLFNQKGVKGATLADVAERVQLLTNSVTYYFRRKEDLAAACFLDTIAALRALALEAGKRGAPEARLNAFLHGYARLLVRIDEGEHADLIRFHDIRALRSPHVETVFAAYTDLFRAVRSLLPAKRPSLDRAGLNARGHLLISVVNAMQPWIARYETSDYEIVAERIADILIGGLGGKSARWAPSTLPALAAARDRESPAQAFLRAATELINDMGYRGASVEKISARLHVTKGSFYHYNDNKDELVANCFQRSFDVIRRAQNAASELDADGWSKLASATAELTRYQLSPRGPLLRASALSALPESMRPALMQTMRRLSERYGHFIVDGLADGSLRAVDQRVAAQLVSDVVNAAAELGRWAPSASEASAPWLFARPLFLGLFAD
jgi:AcrR family transcriptional regulator